MYVCVCNAVTDSQVLRAAQAGVRSLRGLQAHLGVGLECGRCARYARHLLLGTDNLPTRKPQCKKDCDNCSNSKEKRNERRQENAAVPQ